MKAIINENYGSPDSMKLQEVKRPNPGPKQVLVKVMATSVNRADWQILNGSSFAVRLMAGLFKPKYPILGADIVGLVERCGSEVTQFQKGDEVFGDLSVSGFGGFAEYVATDENRLAKKPSNLSYSETAALPMAAVTALQGLRDKGKIQQGQDVLINGASGGVGGFALQIAKAFGAKVTAVCSTNKADLARKLGADTVIDYTRSDFTKGSTQYDLIFDIVGNHSLWAIESALKKGGRYVSCAFSAKALISGPLISLLKGKTMTSLLAGTTQADLQFIARLAEEEKLKPIVQKTFTLDDVPEALRLIGKGRASGKLIITI
ncbi:MAG: NAD(P)-dependent alcohol dehydrogenase [Bacteroidetes bacterium]|nr:NAD(P)-dependent alcohol dehydrogenase [Bacteroidota bacterium]